MADTTITDPRQRHELSDRATKKVFKRLLPFLLLMYVIAFLDRSNVSFAQQEFEVDFGISAASYAFGAGLFFVGYAIFEVPSNLLLHRVGAKWWLSRIMVTWGLVAAFIAMGFVSMQPIFWTLPTEYMTGYAAAAGIGLINSLGNLGGFLAPIQREYFDSTLGGNAGLYSLAVGAVLGAVLFSITAFFKKANEVEAGHLDEVDAHYVPHDVAEAARGPHPSHR
jgi:sugar phosphate permease